MEPVLDERQVLENANSTCLDILGVRVHDVTSEQAGATVQRWLEVPDQRLHHVVTVNPEFIMTARREPDFADVLRRADLATIDGVGIVLAARLFGYRVRQRVTGVDLTLHLAGLRAPSPRLFLLGAEPGIAERAAGKLREMEPGVTISGCWSGGPGEEERAEIVERIERSGADTLLVAFGAPRQDIWIDRHRRELAHCGIVVAIGVGGTFDFLAGSVPRAPGIIRRAGLEWLYRLARQPWRWRRQLSLPLFAALMLRERLVRKGSIVNPDHVDLEY